jgi:UDP-N-acetylmuramoylalanine--D-glutamate ligase
MPDRSTALHGRRVLVAGIGILGGGQNVIRYLLSRGAVVRGIDTRPESDFGGAAAELRALGADLRFATDGIDDVDWAEVIVRNPAVRAESPLLAKARALGTRVEMEIGLFAAACPAPMIMITGSKGKTTTTRWTEQLLRAGLPERRLFVAGNMGVAALPLLDEIAPADLVLLEVSSFQLEEPPAGGWGPHVAVVTNVGDDHLDRYGHSAVAYRAVKLSLTAAQGPGDWLIVPGWDAEILAGTAATAAQRVTVFPHGEPAHGEHWVAVRDGSFVAHGFGATGGEVTVGRAGDLAVPGRHNVDNAAFAVAVALAAGVAAERIGSALAALRAVEHRLEDIATVEGVTFVDDTTATAPMAVVAALDAYPEGEAVVICGGHDKGADYTPMVDALVARAAGVVLLPGVGTDRFRQALVTRAAVTVAEAATMGPAVDAAFALARDGGARRVLLSPGCASFGGFRNEFDRAEQFRGAVERLRTDG